jgi:hypothetical protein
MLFFFLIPVSNLLSSFTDIFASNVFSSLPLSFYPYTLPWFTPSLLLFFGGLNSGLCTCKADSLPLEPCSSPFCSGYFEDGGLLNCDSPNLSLPSSWNYRHESPVPGCHLSYVSHQVHDSVVFKLQVLEFSL